jgi:transcriptional regulator with XRE-family HTH domain
MPITAHASTLGTFLFESGIFVCYRGTVSTDLNTAVGNVLKGEYTKREKTLDDLAAETGIPYSTLRRKIAGGAPIFVAELMAIAKAIPVSAGKVLDEAEELVAMSAADATNDLDAIRRRKQAEASAMKPEDLEAEKHAATRDPELDTDQPD